MTARDLAQAALFFALLTALTVPLGRYLASVLSGERHLLSFPLGWLERSLLRLSGVRPDAEMTWRQYAVALLVFNLLGFLAVFGLLLAQGALPLNPAGQAGTSWHLAFNTAVSFMTNTNWQAYSGESTLSYATQMLGLGVQNFLSAATGCAVLVALVRGLLRRNADTLGNFWVDLTRATVHVLLPLSLVFALVLIWQGVPQTFAAYEKVTTLEGAEQIVPLGPAASQIAIKQLGTNGGGFFGLNSAHPFENPTPLSNFLQLLAILLLPAALTATYGRLIGSARQGWVLFGVMMLLLVAAFAGSWAAELQRNPALPALTENLEGKEVRFGVMNSVLWSTATTAASNGSVNAMHDSLSPLAGGLALLNLLLGEIVFGGVGAGLYGMLLFVLLAVFLAGLMVGRTPEYLGKKIEAREIIWTAVGLLAPGAVLLIGAAISCVTEAGLAGLGNNGAHGLTEILYAWASAANNNGSAFGGLSVNTPFYNVGLGLAMLVGRFAVILPVLAIAGSLATKKYTPASTGTFPTDGWTFAGLLLGVVLIVGALNYFPVLCLGPLAEHFLLLAGRTF
ncbi:MAG: potassium-transporting ATPase subunit KdpA [Verrucomicrobia bacterium]|nr:potassium-transporting ATPase subunit KdpA [Verrucomicrobiota bacterium]